jgi:predicted MFS family arabinose efflux permease
MTTIAIDETKITGEKPGWYHAILFGICFVSCALGGTVSTLMSVYLPVAVKELMGTETANLERVGAFINALFIFGWAIGGFTWGIISDKAGRKKALLFAIAFYGTFTILTGQMPVWWGVMCCRFLSGFGVGGVLVISFTLMSEVWPAKSKTIFSGILSIAFPVGIFSAGLINYFVGSWREGFFAGGIAIVLALAGAATLKESENWQQQRTTNSNSVSTLFSSLHRRTLWISAVTFGTMLIGLWAIFSWLPTWVQSISAAADAQKERGMSMMLLGMGGLTGGFVSGWIAKALGLKKGMILCFAACIILSFLLFKMNTSISPVIYVEILVLALFFGASQGILSAFIPLMFPSSIRATATGFSFNIGRLFTAAAVLSVGMLVTALGGYGNAIFIFSLVFLVGLVMILFLKPKS